MKGLIRSEWEQQRLSLSAIDKANDAMWDEIDREIEETRRQEQTARRPRPNPLALYGSGGHSSSIWGM